MRLSQNFSLDEFAVSGGFPHLVQPVPVHLVPVIQRVVTDILQPIRNELLRPMRINSGYRSRELNKAVGGSVTSQHMRGEAADWTTTDIRGAWITLLNMVADHRLKVAGQMIYYPHRSFIHVALPSGRFQNPTCCVHWPEGGLKPYTPIAPTLAAFNAVVPANLDPSKQVKMV